MAYVRNPRRRVIRGSSSDELRRGGRRTSEEFDPDSEPDFVRLGSSTIGTQQDVVQRIGGSIIGGDFGGNARGEAAIDVQITRYSGTDDDDNPIVGADYVASGDAAVVFGRDSRASGGYSVALGTGNLADGANAIAIGASNEVSVGLGVAIGLSNTVRDFVDGIAIGFGSVCEAFRAISVGRSGRVSGDYGVQLGYSGNAEEIGTVAIGASAYAGGEYSVAVGFGTQAYAGQSRGVAIGYRATSQNTDEAVIAAQTLKMQTAVFPATKVYESVITTSDAAPATGNVAIFADVDRIGDAGFAASDVARSDTASIQAMLTTAYGVEPVENGGTGASTVAEAHDTLDTPSRVNTFVNLAVPTLYGVVQEALTWAAAQIFNAAVSIAATLSGALLAVNQSGTGDIVTLQDAGVTVIRFPDGGGIVVAPQAGGFQVLTGLIGYDNTATGFQRLKFQHEGHTGPVPIDPRNGFANAQIITTYP